MTVELTKEDFPLGYGRGLAGNGTFENLQTACKVFNNMSYDSLTDPFFTAYEIAKEILDDVQCSVIVGMCIKNVKQLTNGASTFRDFDAPESRKSLTYSENVGSENILTVCDGITRFEIVVPENVEVAIDKTI